MHFLYGFCKVNARAAVKNTKGVSPTEGFRLDVFYTINQILRDTGCRPSVAVQSEREVVRKINTPDNSLEMVKKSQHLSTRRMACRMSVSRMQVWRTLN